MGFLWYREEDRKVQDPERKVRGFRRGRSAHLRLGSGPVDYQLSFSVCELCSRESRTQHPGSHAFQTYKKGLCFLLMP